MKVRQQMVAAQIRRLVSTLIPREVADPRVDGIVSVTRVEVSPDLVEARVFVSVFGATHPPATVLHGLQSAARRLQTQVARQLPLRLAPRLSFALDESLKKQDEVLQLLDDVARADAEARPDAADKHDSTEAAPDRGAATE